MHKINNHDPRLFQLPRIMLSICIPIYETDVRPIVSALHVLATKLKVPWEIVCADDFSSPAVQQQNSEITKLSRVHLHYQHKNVGRSIIRNVLAQRAKYPVLIFLDNDMDLVDDQFLERYISVMDHPVVYGGTRYKNSPPVNKTLNFHWKYGKRKEEKSVADRLRAPWVSFKTNNFMVHRSILEHHPFDPNFKYYGYEDLQWIFELKAQGIPLLHIDNPLYHLGLEPPEKFLVKIEYAMQNLAYLVKHPNNLPIRVTKTYTVMTQWKLNKMVRWVGRIFIPTLKHKLQGGKAPLWTLDVYKLLLLQKFQDEHQSDKL